MGALLYRDEGEIVGMAIPPSVVQKFKDELVAAHRVVGNLPMDHRGHISVRLPNSDEILVKARLSRELSSFHDVGRRHITRMTLDGKVVSLGKNLEPPREYFIHTWLYKLRPDVGSVVHIHPKYTIVLGIAGKSIKPVYHLRDAGVVAEELPIFNDPRLIVDDELGRKLAETLGNREACVLRWHGLVTVGKDIHEAALRAMKIEMQAEYNFLALQAGAVNEMPKEYLVDVMETPKLLEADWAYFSAMERV